MIKIAVCDDERYFREHMNHIIFEYMEKNGYDYAITDFESGKEFLKASLKKMDYTIVLAGDKNHGEVTGIAGYAGDKFILVENSNEVSDLKIPSDEKVILLSQTTYSPVEFNKIANIIEEKYQNSKIMNTICPATKERQDALIKLCPIVDGIVVVGGKNSANTKRLLQTALKYCKNAILIERAEEIPSEFLSLNTVGITAGASTPDSVIQEVKSYLENKIA